MVVGGASSHPVPAVPTTPSASTWTDEALGRHIASQGVDIVVDLMGRSRRARGRVIAMRPAPIVVMYLGAWAAPNCPPTPLASPSPAPVCASRRGSFGHLFNLCTPHVRHVPCPQGTPPPQVWGMEWGCPAILLLDVVAGAHTHACACGGVCLWGGGCSAQGWPL